MKQFIYKTLIIVLGIVLVYEFTIGKQIAQFKDRTNILISKEGRRDGVNKLRNEIKDHLPTPFYGLFDFYKKVLPSLIKLAFDLNEYYKVKLPYDQN